MLCWSVIVPPPHSPTGLQSQCPHRAAATYTSVCLSISVSLALDRTYSRTRGFEMHSYRALALGFYAFVNCIITKQSCHWGSIRAPCWGSVHYMCTIPRALNSFHWLWHTSVILYPTLKYSLSGPYKYRYFWFEVPRFWDSMGCWNLIQLI